MLKNRYSLTSSGGSECVTLAYTDVYDLGIQVPNGTLAQGMAPAES